MRGVKEFNYDVIDWPAIFALSGWLRDSNGVSDHTRACQVLKIGEEIGEFASASYSQQVPEMCDVALTALVALCSWTEDAQRVFEETLEEGLSFSATLHGIRAAYGNLCATYIGFVGLNPRKGTTHQKSDVTSIISKIAHTALENLPVLSETADEDFHRHLTGNVKRSIPAKR